MTPEIRLSTKATEKLATIPLSLIDEVERRLNDLASRPVSLSELSAFPFPPGQLMHHFQLSDFAGNRWNITVLFHRLADEQGVFINSFSIQSQSE